MAGSADGEGTGRSRRRSADPRAGRFVRQDHRRADRGMGAAFRRCGTGMTTSVRRLAEADVAAMRDIRLEGLRLHPECFGADLETEEAMTEADFARRMATGITFG